MRANDTPHRHSYGHRISDRDRLRSRKGGQMNRRSHTYLIIAALAALLAFPATANAGVVGQFGPAQVQCDRITNRIDITPNLFISTAYTRQRVAYQLAIYSLNPYTNAGFWLSNPNYNQWFVEDHNSWKFTQLFSEFGTTGQWTQDFRVAAPTHSYFPSDGSYYVWTRYAWEAPLNSGIWYDAYGRRLNDSSPWTKTQSYTNGDWLAGSICKV